MNIDREKIAAKIRALLSKTMDNGCTQEEAMMALEKARAMMDAYEVTPADLELKDEEAAVLGDSGHDPHAVKQFLAMGIGRFCDCKVWKGKDGIMFCGLRSDAELAQWLLTSVSDFVLSELAAHLMGAPKFVGEKGNRRRIINGFVIGCANRISQRLDEMIQKSKTAQTSNSRALVVAKDGLINAKMKSLGISLRKGRSSRRSDAHAYASGQAAGNRATFGRPVGGGSAGLLR